MNRPHPYVYRKAWEDANGMRVPIGHDIHHIDGNPWNNNPSNLVALTVREHYEIHKAQGDIVAASMIKGRLDEKMDYRTDFPTYQDTRLRRMNLRDLGRSRPSPDIVFEDMESVEGLSLIHI